MDDLLIPEQGSDPVEMRALQRLELEQVKKALLDIPPLQRMAGGGAEGGRGVGLGSLR